MIYRTRRDVLTEGALVLAGYTILTLILFQPTAAWLAATIPSHAGEADADALFLVWAIAHVAKTLFTDPWHLFDAPIRWPSRLALAHGDHMIGQALLGLPIWWTTGNPILLYNFVSLASYPVSAGCTYAWLRSSGASRAAAAAGGLVVAFTPFRLHHPQWLQLLVVGFMPLALRSWLRFLASGRWRDWALWVLWWTCHGLMGMYLAIYFSAVLGLLSVAALLVAPAAQRTRLLLGTITAPLAVGVLLAPTLWPYVAARWQQGFVRDAVYPTPLTWLLPAADTWTGAMTGVSTAHSQGPGLLVVGLALLGLLAYPARQDAFSGQSYPRPHRLVAVLGLAFTLAFLLLPPGWQSYVPAFDMLRSTNRALLVALLFVAFFAARGWDALRTLVPGQTIRRILGTLFLLLLAADSGLPRRERDPLSFGPDLPPLDRWLKEHLPTGTPVFELALSPAMETRGMLLALLNGTRLVNGYSGFMSPGHEYLRLRMAGFPDHESLVALHALGVRWVIVRSSSTGPVLRVPQSIPAPWVTLAAQFADGAAYEIHGAPPEPPLARQVATLGRDDWWLDESSATGTLPLLVDGDVTTSWRMWVSRGHMTPALTIDLGQPRPVTGIRATSAKPHALGLYLAEISVALEAPIWESTGARFRPDDLSRYVVAPQSVDTWIARFPTRHIRWIQLTNSQLAFWGGWWEMAEVDVLLDEEAAVR